ncbi:tRNA 2-thiouridine(34) synthase MnmA [Acidisoma sp. 7E03]
MRIVVAMSGGVDSSVVAGLLAEQGHEVIGVTLQLYDHGAAAKRKGACCAGEDIHDARRVADRLGIPHYVIDAEARFRAAVMEDFAASYAAGETPVPCVRCNQSVKFGDLVAMARDLGAEAMATGHYVRRIEGPQGPELHRAVDPQRDQSWFLFATTRDQLAFSRFPLGSMPDKAAVRAEAARLGLAVAVKPDSQDICFVPQGRYTDIIAKLRPEALEPGEIVDAEGRVLGQHEGIARYTVGQAKRLRLTRREGEDGPVVTQLDPARRRVVVGPRQGGVREVRLREVNWLAEVPPEGLRVTVKMRARAEPAPALVQVQPGGGALVTLDTPALPAPGQGCVFYDGDRVLGGGFIERPMALGAVGT